MARDPYQSIAPCRLSRSSEQVPSAVGPDLLHPALLRARVKVALTPLLVFGSPVSQTLPSKVQETCGCLVPTVIRIEDNMKMTVVPRENEEAIPIQVEKLLAHTVGLQ